MRSSRIIWLVPRSNGKCPNKKQKRRETEREGPVKTEAETGVLQSQAQECQWPPEAGRGQEQNHP